MTTRGISAEQIHKLGIAIGKFLSNPSTDNEAMLQTLVRETAVLLPNYHDRWLCEVVRDNLERNNFLVGSSDSTRIANRSRLSKLVKGAGKVLHSHHEQNDE